MLRAHRPAGPARAYCSESSSLAASSRRAAQREEQCKRARSPCEDEVAVKTLLTRKHATQSRVRQQIEVLSGLENNVLEFYYTHMVRFEPLLESACHGAATATASLDDAVVGNELAALFPALGTRTALTDAFCGSASLPAQDPAPSLPPVVPAKTRYYYDSALMRLYREAAFQEKELARKYTSEQARVEASELSLQRDIIDGSLAVQLMREREERETLRKLTDSLAEVTAQCTAHEQAMQAVEERMKGIERATEACLARQAVLETRKEEQMSNAERIKEDVSAFRLSVEAASRELERRKLINCSLDNEIARRRAALKRRKRE
ncbi:hypothetical protein LSCM1_02198 [Leishmania martiniquensis]|uniref:Uncharacterized protein n=1 Tax=Leishmania martiniquensis TaxID=1580590 RepID=A0A836GZU7_9TRYP|nr:hypothetical protein LSCM1_02198 [Leishmania martiniquensis]